jgi:Glyoxalase-like domain
MARLKEIVVDALHPAALARFWAAALDGYSVRPYDAAEIARLARAGFTPETDPAVAVDGDGPTLFFQQAATVNASRNRVHLDVACESRSREVARLERLGARVRDVRATHTVMLDPEGNAFCVQGEP